MTYDEISKQLAECGMNAGEHIYLVKGDQINGTALYFIPVRWFIAMKDLAHLYIGVYEGDELRLVGTKNPPFAEVTTEWLKDELDKAMADQVGRLLDPEALKMFLSKFSPRTGRAGLGSANDRFRINE